MWRVCFGQKSSGAQKESLKLRRLERATAPIERETPHRTRDSVALSPSRSEAARSVPTVGNSLARPTTNSGQSTHSSAALWDSSLPSLLERRLAGAKVSHESAQSS